MTRARFFRPLESGRRDLVWLVALASIACAGCGGGGGSGSSGGAGNTPNTGNTGQDATFASPASTARFLTQASFGPTEAQVSALTGGSASAWLQDQLNRPASRHLPLIVQYLTIPLGDAAPFASTFSFWVHAVGAEDQLRQRMAFALSEIMVVSDNVGALFNYPLAKGYYQDLLTLHALGNYRDLLEDVTYSPAMAYYLTYLQNQKGDALTGRVPDENYARELLQLFCIGTVLLHPDGSQVLDASGQPVETYTNDDITGLARVFTGLSLEGPDFFSNFMANPSVQPSPYVRPLKIFPAFHSALEKSFLGTTIAANTGAAQTIELALDAIFAHPNLPPFVSRQLIQRFVTSNPSPGYIQRVAGAFASGSFILPDGSTVGLGRRGDLAATIASILFDSEARSDSSRSQPSFGKLREPIIRFTGWARAFSARDLTPEYIYALWGTQSPAALAQHPYRAPSVFNFFRPGYVAPGTRTAAAGLTMPELQIVNATSTPGYINFMTWFVSGGGENTDVSALQDGFNDAGIPLDAQDALTSFVPDYSAELVLAGNPTALVERLDQLLTYGTMSAETKLGIEAAIAAIPLQATGFDGAELRVQTAVLMALTSPDYLVQR